MKENKTLYYLIMIFVVTIILAVIEALFGFHTAVITGIAITYSRIAINTP